MSQIIYKILFTTHFIGVAVGMYLLICYILNSLKTKKDMLGIVIIIAAMLIFVVCLIMALICIFCNAPIEGNTFL